MVCFATLNLVRFEVKRINYISVLIILHLADILLCKNEFVTNFTAAVECIIQTGNDRRGPVLTSTLMHISSLKTKTKEQKLASNLITLK